jgi:hypothetical protein
VTCWEEGIKPDGISFRFKEIKDDRGNDLLGDDADPFTGESGSDLAHSYDRSFRSRTLPDPGASKLSRLWLQAGVHFTLRSATATFKDANLADGCTLTSDELSVRLEKFEERDGQASGSLLVGIPEGRFVPSDLIRIALKEEGGKETRIGAPSLRDGRLQVAFCAGGAPQKLGKIAELRITLPTEVHTETVELDFRDLPLKR